ncbi:alanine--tRNA ligase [Enterobacteriaceae endosymbiont of Macroplea mutica]|uniref:alanine--tRNA ligase n=1 Tax=Enterobacteriaceae endosymbiont of Macroplea mutica TaxID=2675791 RepID=UPI0014494B62|nr:alanine--tRNA ligase [Enterobacteriaceae endosymbiont of Macroplea mutica]QJC31076.1 alanine--tRNA ligase [Enterobacteriaceae endosymbiont of Macroplea mutica]
MVCTTTQICQMFLDFFHIKKHKIMPGSSIIPHNDNSLLFTNAGMNQFKKYFLGAAQSPYPNIVTVQKCVRAGGKNNDLKNIGFTNRHHTFFEMLGNFSFGNYFKEEAITLAWELLTCSKWFHLNPKKIFITVYYTDTETYNIWLNKIGIPKTHIILIYDKNNQQYYSDNFWHMDTIGPCGPSTEIFYDLGEHLSGNIQNNTGERFIEIWNIVFIQFNQNLHKQLTILPIKSIDTGMGLERISSILQGVDSIYKIDIFEKLIQHIAHILHLNFIKHHHLNVIADHLRTSIFLIAYGVMPSNEHRGYILRKIIRRAINHGIMLGYKNIFLYKLVQFFINEIAFNRDKELLQKQYLLIKNTIKQEEQNFHLILTKGISYLKKEILYLENNILPGEKIFYLYDTLGLSLDAIKEICLQQNIIMEQNIFLKLLNKQRSRSKNNSLFKKNINVFYHNSQTQFLGYNHINTKSKILNIYFQNHIIQKIIKNDKAIIILDITPFYGESGGQLGDIGFIKKNNENIFQVITTTIQGNLILHNGIMIQGELVQNDIVTAEIDLIYRNQISRNHTATHLLNYSLRKILGTHIQQKGSLITSEYFRFDFLYNLSITSKQIINIENMINQYIFKNIHVTSYNISKQNINLQDNIIFLQNEQYNDIVRVIHILNLSKELCCGTHVTTTCEIGLLKIIKCLSIAHGIKRIHAVTHKNALSYIQTRDKIIKSITEMFKIDDKNVVNYIMNYQNKNSVIHKRLQKAENYIAKQIIKKIIQDNIIFNNINLLISELYDYDPIQFNYILKNMINKFDKFIIILSTIWIKKIFILIKITPNLNINALDIINLNISNTTKYNINGTKSAAQIIINNNIDQYYCFISKIKTFILNKINMLLHEKKNN